MKAVTLFIIFFIKFAKQSGKFSGLIFDSSNSEEDVIDFEIGYQGWIHQGVKIIDINSAENVDEIPSAYDDGGGSVLVPEPDGLSGASPHVLYKNFTFGAESKLEMWFSLYVYGYNASVVPQENVPDLNPSFTISIIDLSSGNESEILDLARCNVTDDDWTHRQFYINVKEEASATIKFQMSRNADSNSIALDDVKIQWVPVLKTEINLEHSNVLFHDSDDVETTTSSTSDVSSSTVTASPTPSPTSGVSTETTETTTNSGQTTAGGTTENTTSTSTEVNSTSVETTTNGEVNSTMESTTSEEVNSTMESTTSKEVNSTMESTTSEEVNSTEVTTSSAEVNETTTTATNEEISTVNITTTEGDLVNTTMLTTVSVEVNQTSTLKSETTTSMSEPTANQSTEETSPNSTINSTTEASPDSTTNSTEESVAPTVASSTETSSSSTVSSTTTSSNSTASQSPIIDSEKFSGYGYPAEVALICLVVLFGVMFLVMVVKYYRLRTTIGDYRLRDNNGGRQTYDNPAFNGFGLQDTYRSR